MMLLEQILAKSESPVRAEDIEEFIHLYGQAIRIVTITAEDGHLAGMAVLAPPIRLLGKTVCQVVLLGTDGTVDGRILTDKMKATAKAWGADVVIGPTHRRAARGKYADALARRYGAKIDSVNLRWEL